MTVSLPQSRVKNVDLIIYGMCSTESIAKSTYTFFTIQRAKSTIRDISQNPSIERILTP